MLKTHPFHNFSKVAIMGALLIAALETPAYGKIEGIDLWVRGKGHYEKKAIDKKSPVKSESLSLPLKTAKLHDAQYEKERVYQGVGLSRLIDAYKAPLGDSTGFILHFDNGMIIPMEFTDRVKEKVFIATGFKDSEKAKSWRKDFPAVAKKDELRYFRDPNPTVFKNNKIVIPLLKRQLYFKDAKGKLVPRFSPWSHVSSLTGVEFVNLNAYYKQFDISDKPDHKRGFAIFKARCQYCHGVRGVGASFGWDYGGPIKVSKKRDAKSLHLFVKYPKADALERGLKMPNQIDLKKDDADKLWKWISLMESRMLNAYN